MKLVFSAFTLLFFHIHFSQNGIQTDIQNKKIDFFINVEKKLGSKIYKSNQNYVSFRNVVQPIIYERKEQGIPNLQVSYTLFKTDSTIAEILYEWDVYNYEKDDDNKKSVKFDKNLIKKYLSIVNDISKKYGKSIQNGNLKNFDDIHTSKGLNQSDQWKINDSLTVNSYINLSEFYKKDNMVTINPTHRIKVYVKNERNEKEKELPKLSSGKIAEYNKNFLEFIQDLKVSDFTSARKILSDKIKDAATDEILKILNENIEKDKKLENFMVGFQILMDGKNYPMMQYKYADDNFNPPRKYIVVIFEDDGKILVVKPMNKVH